MANYTAGLLASLAEIPTPHRFFVYLGRREKNQLNIVAPGASLVLGPPVYPIREQLSVPWRCVVDQLDILHCPGNTCPLFIPRRLRLVVTIHDAMFMMNGRHLPPASSIYQRLGAIYYRLTAVRAAKLAKCIITVSNCSAKDLQDYLGVEPSRVRVVYIAPGPDMRILSPEEARAGLAELKIAGRFIMCIGGHHPRKNTHVALKAFAAAKEARRRGLKLVVTGIGGKWVQTFRRQASKLGIEAEVIFTGFVSRGVLVSLYNCADFVIYPSLYEGFGLPVLEAMACGKAVISSTAGSIPEVAGDAAILIDPQDWRTLADSIDLLATDSAFRASLCEKGVARAREFSWQKTAYETLKIYEECLED